MPNKLVSISQGLGAASIVRTVNVCAGTLKKDKQNSKTNIEIKYTKCTRLYGHFLIALINFKLNYHYLRSYLTNMKNNIDSHKIILMQSK